MIAEDHFEFLEAVWTRRTPFTFIFLCVNIGIFLLMEFTGSTTDPSTLMAFGVKSNPEILQGEWFRLITPIFIHIGLLHLFFNSYALWIVGQQVEKLYGSARFVVVYVLTGVAGVLGSFFYNPENISAGASGAIMGLFGVLLVFGLKYRRSIPPAIKQAVGTGVLPVIIINIIIGFTIEAIDNSAHIAGLVSGAVLAAAIPFQRPGDRTPPIYSAMQAGLLALVVVSFYSVASNYSASPQAISDALSNAERTFTETAQALRAGRTEGLPAMSARVGQSIEQLRSLPSIDATADGLVENLLRVMEAQYTLIQDIARSGAMAFPHSLRLTDNMREFQVVMRSLSEWAARDGRKHGIQMGKRP